MLATLKSRRALLRKLDSSSYYAVIISGEKNSCLVVGESLHAPDFSQGEVIELGLPQPDDALYVRKATVGEVIRKENILVILLKDFTELSRYQRRSSERQPVKLKAGYNPLVTDFRSLQEGYILDISENGALFAAKDPLRLGSEVYLCFEDPRLNEPVGVIGKTVRRHLPQSEAGSSKWLKYYFGVEFQTQPLPSRLSVWR